MLYWAACQRRAKSDPLAAGGFHGLSQHSWLVRGVRVERRGRTAAHRVSTALRPRRATADPCQRHPAGAAAGRLGSRWPVLACRLGFEPGPITARALPRPSGSTGVGVAATGHVGPPRTTSTQTVRIVPTSPAWRSTRSAQLADVSATGARDPVELVCSAEHGFSRRPSRPYVGHAVHDGWCQRPETADTTTAAVALRGDPGSRGPVSRLAEGRSTIAAMSSRWDAIVVRAAAPTMCPPLAVTVRLKRAVTPHARIEPHDPLRHGTRQRRPIASPPTPGDLDRRGLLIAPGSGRAVPPSRHPAWSQVGTPSTMPCRFSCVDLGSGRAAT